MCESLQYCTGAAAKKLQKTLALDFILGHGIDKTDLWNQEGVCSTLPIVQFTPSPVRARAP